MASAIIAGLFASGASRDDIVLTATTPERASAKADTLGCRAADSNAELAASLTAGDILVLACKPYQIEKIANEIDVDPSVIVVSLAAGTPLSKLAPLFTAGQPIVRVMPNVGAHVRSSMTGIAPSETVSNEQLQSVIDFCEAFGEAAVIDEAHFPIFTGIAGCSPAFTFEYIEALARAGVKNGLKHDDAVQYAAQAVAGAAQLLLDSESSPNTLRDTVCSPGGTTIAGVAELDSKAFTATVTGAVEATMKRDRELSASSD